MTDRELLRQLFAFLAGRNYVKGDPESIRDMVRRYQQPPLNMHYRICAQMTKAEYDSLSILLVRIQHHLKPPELTEDQLDESV